MRLTSKTQLAQIARQLCWFSMAQVIACFLVTNAISAQDNAPAYSPGSVPQEPFSLLENAPETGDWTPPRTDVQESPSDWIPPQTPVEAAPMPVVAESEFSEGFGRVEQQEELLIAPPESSDDSDAVVPTLVPEANTPQSLLSESYSFEDAMQTPSVLPLPSSSMEDTIVYGPSEVVGDDLIVFDEDCFTFDENSVACESCVESVCDSCSVAECVPGESETILSDSFAVEGGVRTTLPRRSIINDHFSTPREKVGAEVLGRTVQAGKNIVGKGTSIARNAGARVSQGNVLGRQRIYTPVRNVLGTFNRGLAGNESVHAVGQLTFLSFARDYRGRGRQLGQGVPNLFANGPDEGNFTGVDLSYGRRRAGGQGWEMRYIGFDPQQASDVSGATNLVWGGLTPPLNDPATFGGFIDPNTPRTFGLSGLGLGNFSMADIFNDAQNHRVTRDSEFGSFEFNLLRAAAGNTRLSCGDAVVELFGGLRGVAINESIVFAAGATQSAQFPRSAFYSSEVKNSLFGLQIGGRMERQKAKGWGYSFGTRVGIYNNRVESRQRAEYAFDDGSRPSPVLLFGDNAGEAFDFEGKDNELAFLGELDFGLIYQFRPQTRARFGYRGIVVTNVAIAADQLEDSLFDVDLVSQPRAIGDFIVGGLYFGVDHAF